MEMGFIADISIILEELDKQKESLQGRRRRKRRSVLLSATLNKGMSLSLVVFPISTSKYSYECVHLF